MKRSSDRDLVSLVEIGEGPIGIVSTSGAAIVEVVCLLARDGVTVSRVIPVGGDDREGAVLEAEMLAGLRSLQVDPRTEMVILISGNLLPDQVEQVLAQVRSSDKPTVACFLDSDQRLVWRAGAIPAARLDEAALRAVAWVRGWDQALISSQLEDEHDQLAGRAGELRGRIGSGRYQLQGLFASQIFCQEAQLLLHDIVGEGAVMSCLYGEVEQRNHLRQAFGDPAVAVIVVNLILGLEAGSELYRICVELLASGRERPLVVADVCDCGGDMERLADMKARLQKAGAILMPSNASAARLAGMVIKELAKA